MRRAAQQVVYTLCLALIFSTTSAIQASAADCTPTTSVGSDGYTTVEFTNPNAANNTNGSNNGFSCTWKAPLGVTSLYVVVVGGGGSGGNNNQGGGGGGGQVLYTQSEIRISSGATHTIVVGSGGLAQTSINNPGNDGALSSFNGISANGGGGGGGGNQYSGVGNLGRTGGSSGGSNRMGATVTPPTQFNTAGWISLGNAGGVGAGRPNNDAGVANSAGAENCYAYGQGGGGGGAMRAGQNASASCTGSRAQDAVTVSGGAGGAGVYILGRCLGGGGATAGPTNSASNLGSSSLTNPTTTACLDLTSGATVSGTQSGGGYGQTGVANTGGGGGGAVSSATSYAGANGIVLVRYFLGVTSGLVASFDAQNPSSYSGSGSTWNDLSGNGYNATLTGASKSSSNGGYMNFSGSSQYATLPTISSPSTILWNAGFTVAFYANFTSSNAWQRIIDFGTGASTNNILVASPSANKLHVEVYQDASNFSNCSWANSIPTGEWHHYAVGFSGTDCFLYVDGSPTTATTSRTKVTAGASSNPGSITAVPSNSDRTSNFIAKSNWSNDLYYAGGIRSLAIYNRALSATEINIEKLYQADTSAPTISSISFTSSPSGVSYLPGETITVTTTWSETVTVTSTPQIPILGLSSKNLVYATGSGTKVLTFTYVVTSGDSAINGIGLTANSFNTGSGSIADQSYNTPNYNFSGISISTSHKVGAINATISLALAGNATTATYRTPITITATVSAPGKVSFYYLGKVITGCKNVPTVTSGSITATCSWRPAVRNAVSLKAAIAPSNGMTAASSNLDIQVLRRATNR